MIRVVESSQLMVEEVVRYEWGPFASREAALDAVWNGCGELVFESGLVRAETKLGSWWLDERGSEWWWVGLTRRWEHRGLREDEKLEVSQ